MYGNKPPAARRLAQPLQKYADGGMVARMKSASTTQPQRLADGGFVSAAKRMMGLTPEDPARAARLAEYKANAEREKAAAKAASAPATAPAPQAAISQYSGMSAMQRREKEQGLADGGVIRGPGTGTSDSIATEAEPGTFIMPADSTKALGKSALEKLATVPVKLSNGEFEFPPEQVMAVGAAVLKLLKDTTHKPVNGEDGGQTDDEAGEGPGHEMAEAIPGGQEDDAEDGMGYRPADRMALMPPMMFADGGMVAPRRMDIGQWAQGMEQWRGEQAIADARQAKAFQDQADADEYARQQAEASKLRDQQQAGGAQPQLGFADGGMVENDITRVGNSYSGGNVGGNVSINGQTGGGTVSTTSWTSPVPAPAPTPVATAAPTAQQPAAAPATTAATPAPAPAPAAPMGWAERNAQRDLQVTASSIMDSPERRAAQAKLSPAPAPVAPVAPTTPAVGGIQPATTAMDATKPKPFGAQPASPFGFKPRGYADGGTVRDEEKQRLANQADMYVRGAPALGQPAPGEQPRRYAGGGTVKDEERAVFGLYPQLADSQRTTYAAAEKLRSGVVASGPSTFAPALKPAPIAQPAIRGGGDGRRMNAQQDPRSLVYAGRPQIAETADVAPAQAAAQGQAPAATVETNAPAATVETNAPAALPSGSVSAQDDAAAGAVSRRGAADALAQMPNAPAPVTAPTVRNSTNDWAARKALENMATAASSITNRPEWQSGSTTIAGSTRGPKGEGDPEGKVAAYKAALANDLALQQAQPGMDQAAMRENAGIQREALQQAGATTRTGMTEQGSNTREAGRTALAQGELGLKREAQGFQTRALQRLEKLYERYDAAKTPEERAAIAQQLRELQVKDAPARMQTVTLPDTTNEMGQVVRGGQALVRELRDGTVQQVPIGAAPAPQALPPKDQLKAGKTYSTPRGQARWDGNQFIPV